MIARAGYQVVEKLYESSRSLVYRGCRLSDECPVVLKWLKQEYPTSDAIARFKLEYEITRNLSLSGTIRAYSLEKHGHSLMMVLEDFGGQSLNQMTRDRSLTLEELLTIAVQVSEILGQIHQHHIIHKDINPSNIVLNPVTGQLKIIDFGISAILNRENPALTSPHVLEGTLPYMSPEQTGRMNRSLDYRTDFYSFGVTLYELFTRQRPFNTGDVLEIVHCHLAREPVPPHVLSPDLPQAISQIILKLMAKVAEDRYQSAAGIRADLEACLHQLQETGAIAPFPLARQDISPQLQIPQKLYGRDAEVEALLAAFAEVAGNAEEKQDTEKAAEPGKSQLVLVSGYSGIGKSALVREIYRPITRQHGYFIAGKFDQYQRDRPYSAVVNAFSNLVQQLLSEPDDQLQQWRENLHTALGENGQVIVDVIPEIELIIGQQPTLPDVGATEAQNRFNLVFQSFIQVLAQPAHPLVLFLDDLQWADVASLNLIHLLLVAPDSRYLFVVGAYRNNEVGTTHPLLQTVENMQQEGATIRQILLSPLRLPHVAQLIADTLGCSPTVVRSLAQLLIEKTGGNPFFLKEFLTTLYAEGLLHFADPSAPSTQSESARGGWTWDIAQIHARDITQNVVELLTDKIQRLEPDTQETLKLAACIGNQFKLEMLANLYGRSPQETVEALREAVLAGLITPLTSDYKLVALGVQEQAIVDYRFAHDRIQQAAYSLIADAERPTIHYRIGHLLAQSTPPDQRDTMLFDMVNQLNLGQSLIQSQGEREDLARLNLQAGERAQASAAYDSAFRYLQVGLSLLEESGWHTQYELALALHQTAAKAAYLSGHLDQMEQLSAQVIEQARTLLDAVKVYEVKMQAYAAQTQFRKSIQIALEGLALLGIHFPVPPTPTDIEQAFGDAAARWRGRSIPELADLPPMTDAIAPVAMRFLVSANAPAFQAAPELFPLIVLKLVTLSIEYGNTDLSPLGYGLYAIILGGILIDTESSYQFGQLGLALLDRFNNPSIRCKTLFVTSVSVRFRKIHLKETIPALQEAYQIGVNHGEIEFAGYSALHYCDHLLFTGFSLPQLDEKISDYVHALAQLKEVTNADALRMYRQVVLNLMHPSAQPDQLIGEVYDESVELPLLQQANHHKGLFYLYFNKLMLGYLFGDYRGAIAHAALADQYLDGGRVNAVFPIYYFYDSLARLALYQDANPTEQSEWLQRVAANQTQMEHWAEHAPMNYRHKFLLVEAERCRLLGDSQQALDLYDRAIALAEEHDYIQEAAIAYELAAKTYLASGKLVIAKAYLQEARYCYVLWGAMAKVQALETRYPELLQQRTEKVSKGRDSTHSSTSSSPNELDLVTVMKASQAIASELVLDRLLSTLLKVAIENAGAQTGYLMLETSQGLVMSAMATSEQKTICLSQPLPVEESEELCSAIVTYVTRTQTPLVLGNATQDERFMADPCILHQQPKSILCLPLVNQSKLTGVLYLENNLIPDAFKPDRVELLNVLSTQMAIAIENARLLKYQEELYQSLQLEQAQIARILERITDGFIALDREWTVIYINQRAEQQLGTSSHALLRKNFWEAYPEVVHTTFYQQYVEAIDTGKPVHFEEFYSPTGHWLEINAYPDQDGLSVFFKDISERKRMERKLVHDARHDALTGLPNRLLLTERLEQAIHRAREQADYRFAVLFLDVDRFKVINDSLGHLVGDELLVAIARRLEDSLGLQDTVARLGGDEFIILLDNPADEAEVAARLQLALNVPFDLNGYKVFNTISIGIVSSSTGYDRPEELLRAADIAMYQAKAEGKARYVVFDTTMHEQATSLLKLETDLRWAIERQELRVYYQPIVLLQTGELVGFEALLRWLHPEQGLIAPSKFIPLAEETGLIVPMGQWVLQEACRQLQEWRDRLLNVESLTMSVNLSVKQFSQTDLVEQIDRTLHQLDLDGKHLKLEITESALINNPDVTRELLFQLRDRQIQLCIDDFGTGYSSLSYLHQFPVNILKIDRSFIRTVGATDQDAEIVRTILNLGRNLAITVVAEGIETAAQLAELRTLRCDYGQGYLFARPLNREAAEALIASSPRW